MQYASLVLEARQRAPAWEVEQHNIPSDLAALRTAIGAAQKKQQDGLGGMLQSSDALGNRLAAPVARPEAALNGGSAVQSELARLRFQVDHLREENAMQAAELAAAQGVLAQSGGQSQPSAPEMPLQMRVQALQAELHDARLRAQHSTGVANAYVPPPPALPPDPPCAPFVWLVLSDELPFLVRSQPPSGARAAAAAEFGALDAAAIGPGGRELRDLVAPACGRACMCSPRRPPPPVPTGGRELRAPSSRGGAAGGGRGSKAAGERIGTRIGMPRLRAVVSPCMRGLAFGLAR